MPKRYDCNGTSPHHYHFKYDPDFTEYEKKIQEIVEKEEADRIAYNESFDAVMAKLKDSDILAALIHFANFLVADTQRLILIVCATIGVIVFIVMSWQFGCCGCFFSCLWSLFRCIVCAIGRFIVCIVCAIGRFLALIFGSILKFFTPHTQTVRNFIAIAKPGQNRKPVYTPPELIV